MLPRPSMKVPMPLCFLPSGSGRIPIEAVTTMNNVAISVEKDPTYREVIEASRVIKRTTIADGIVAAAREIAKSTDIKAICCFTQSGTTVSLVTTNARRFRSSRSPR